MEYILSVIVPVYNAEKTIRRCAESVLLGKLRDVQLILVDDCSTDRSWDICRQLSQEFSNVTCIRNDVNSGVSATRNRALSAARGEYLLFVDSDDWVSGNYAAALWNCVKTAPADALVLCTYHYISYVDHTSIEVPADGEPHQTAFVPITDAFTLLEKTFLQQLWNKIFRRDVIERHRIRFDESMRMGEDFQFVLEYMEAIACKTCVVLNEPLYYYIRWNNSSLMGNFGFVENQDEFNRIRKLARMAGPKVMEQAELMLAQNRRNYVYHIARNPLRSREEKLAAIERVMGDGRAMEHYRSERRGYAKEWLADALNRAKTLYPRLKARMDRKQQARRIAQITSEVRAKDVTIISQNCIGGVFYHDLGMQFLSPTVNTFIPEPGFLKMVLNLREYMALELQLHWGEEYPVGTLGDVEIHFMHYKTCREARESWQRRVNRINYDKILVLCTDRDGFNDDTYALWKQVPYPKILFTAHSEYMEDAIYYPEYAANGQIGDLIRSRKFYKDNRLVEAIGAAM